MAQWIASCRAIPASPTASPAAASVMPTSDGLPIAWLTPSTAAGLVVSGARTCRGTRTGSSPILSRLWKDWVAALRSDCSARRNSVSPTDASGCSSWPTATVTHGEYTGPNGTRKPKLHKAAQRWPTPRTSDTNGAGLHGDGGMDLRTAASTWPTPMSRDHRSGHSQKSDEELWGKKGKPLERVATTFSVSWPTPSAGNFNDGEDLDNWHARRERQAAKGINGNGMGMTTAIAAASLSSALAPVTPAGPTSSPERRTLNPLFVEWLMGWPIGWTGSAPVETASCRWWQDMRGELSRLVSRQPRQAALL